MGLVTQLCPTLCDPVDCSPPDSSVHGDSPSKNTGVGCHVLLQGIFPTRDQTQVSCLHCRQILYQVRYTWVKKHHQLTWPIWHYGILHQTSRKYILLDFHGTFINTDHNLSHKIRLNKSEKMEIIWSMFSDYTEIKSETSKRNVFENIQIFGNWTTHF